MALSDYNATAASNTSIGGIGISGASSVNLGDNVMRQMAADIKAGVITGYTTTATAAGTTTLTVASNSYQYFTGATTQTVVMPVTSTLELGRAWVFVNDSTGTLTINSSGGNAITTVVAGTVTIVQCVLITGTSAASWDASIIGFSSSTGTGAVVRATSPTLTTATLAGTTTVSGGQLAFPATQSASANANTLDDYEEGTGTADMSLGGARVGMTQSASSVQYTKVGNCVTWGAVITLTAKGSSTGAVTITLGSLPTPADLSPVTVGAASSFSGLTGALVANLNTSLSVAMRQSVAAGNSAITDTSITDTTSFRISGTYFTA